MPQGVMDLAYLGKFDQSQGDDTPEIDESLWASYCNVFDPPTQPIPQWIAKDISWVIPSFRFKNKGNYKGFYYAAILDYYPVNRFKDVPEDVAKIRRTIFDFKDGKIPVDVAKAVASALYNDAPTTFPNWAESNLVFMTIPASTGLKTDKRFKLFCGLVSKYLGIRNGYKAISIVNDREESKGKKDIDKTINLVYDASVFKGKAVFLFDDVKTSGESFYQNASKLKSLGASMIIGVFFLGETYDRLIGVPYWERDKSTVLPGSSSIGQPVDLPF